MSEEEVLLPMPSHLEPKVTKQVLATRVRILFYQLYNSTAAFRRYLQSVNNKTSVTKNRGFDRLRAVDMMREAAKKADDSIVLAAPEGEIYKYISRLLQSNGMGLRLRREQWKKLTHSPAE